MTCKTRTILSTAAAFALVAYMATPAMADGGELYTSKPDIEKASAQFEFDVEGENQAIAFGNGHNFALSVLKKTEEGEASATVNTDWYDNAKASATVTLQGFGVATSVDKSYKKPAVGATYVFGEGSGAVKVEAKEHN